MKTFHALLVSSAMAGLVATGSGLATEPEIQKHSVYELRVLDGSGDPVELRLDSAEMGFDVFDLAEGESYSFTTESGLPVTVSNVDGKMWLDVDGELIELNGIHDHADSFMTMFGKRANPGITISGAGDLDEETRARIVQAIQDAGVDQDVFFADDMQFHWVAGDGGDFELDYELEDLHAAHKQGAHKQIVIRREGAIESGD